MEERIMEYNMSLKTLWFNKRTKSQEKALKHIAAICSSDNWSFINHFEDPCFGTSLWLFNRFIKKDDAIEIVNTINTIDGVKGEYDSKENEIIVIFLGGNE